MSAAVDSYVGGPLAAKGPFVVHASDLAPFWAPLDVDDDDEIFDDQIVPDDDDEVVSDGYELPYSPGRDQVIAVSIELVEEFRTEDDALLVQPRFVLRLGQLSDYNALAILRAPFESGRVSTAARQYQCQDGPVVVRAIMVEQPATGAVAVSFAVAAMRRRSRYRIFR
jgi:hypothetical protein